MIDQSLFEGLPGVPPVHVEADVAFAPSTKSTTVTVHDTRAAEGTVTTEARVELPDDGPPRVRHAQGDLDVAGVLKWVPAGLVPATVTSARLRYAVDGLTLAAAPRFDAGGQASVDLDLSGLRVQSGAAAVDVDTVALSVQARPAEGGGIAAKGTVRAGSVRGERNDCRRCPRAGDRRRRPPDRRPGQPRARSRCASRTPRSTAGPQCALAAGASSLQVDPDLRPNAAAPLATLGSVAIGGEVASLVLGPDPSRGRGGRRDLPGGDEARGERSVRR